MAHHMTLLGSSSATVRVLLAVQHRADCGSPRGEDSIRGLGTAERRVESFCSTRCRPPPELELAWEPSRPVAGARSDRP